MLWLQSLTEIELLSNEGTMREAKGLLDAISFAEVPDGSDLHVENLAKGLLLRSLGAEIEDYLGAYSRSAEIVGNTGTVCHRILADKRQTAALSRDALLQMVWVVLEAGMCKFRAGSFDDALTLFHQCDGIMSDPLWRNERDPHFGLRARIRFCMGLTYREQYDLERSMRYLVASTELGYQSFRSNELDPTHPRPKTLTYAALARSIGNGLVSVHITMGRPDLAIPLLTLAKAMLPPNEDIISTHLDLIRATLGNWSYVAKSRGGARSAEPHDAEPNATLTEIRRCYEKFKSADHCPYQTRAAYALARHLIGSAKDDIRTAEARNLIAELEFPASNDHRSHLMSKSLRSQLERKLGNAREAERIAQDGLRETSRARYPAVYLDLLRMLGLAQCDLREYPAAHETFLKGQEFAEEAGNNYAAAGFLLGLSRAQMLNNKHRDANSAFRRFQSAKRYLVVTTAELQQAEEATRAVLEPHKGDGYVLKFHENFKADEEVLKLQREIVRIARADPSLTKGAQADIVGLKRQTLDNWEEETAHLK